MKILEQDYKLVPIDTVRPHPRNPRAGDIDIIEESIEENDFYGACLVQKSTGFILIGNHRWKAAKQLDAEQIPIFEVDVDDNHAERILLADNRTSDVATYVDALLADILTQRREDGRGLKGTGFTDDALDALLADLGRDDHMSQGLSSTPFNQPDTSFILSITVKTIQERDHIASVLRQNGFEPKITIGRD
jgi:ParB-like chromosome segregation protein Spo0J